MRIDLLGAPMCAVVSAALAAHAESGAAAAAPALPSSVISYPAAFFASMGLNTAYDMVQRVPGFTFDDGSAVRGFAGAAGNVLIDGQRPASKTDDLISVLNRIPAAQVERIDLIRGATPGIDMQGKTVVANVIRRKASGVTGAATLGQYTVRQGYTDPDARLEGTWKSAGRSLDGSLVYFKGHDDSHGSGRHEIRGPDGQIVDISAMRNSNPTWQYKATSAYEAPLWSGRIRANVILEAQQNEVDSVDVFRLAGRQAEHDKLDPQDAEAGLHYTRDLTGNLSGEVFALQHLNRLHVDSTFRTRSEDQAFDLHDRGGESIERGVLHWRPSASLTVDGGGEFAFTWLSTRTHFSINGQDVPVPAGDVRVSEQRGEASLNATWRPWAPLSLEAGLRVETSTIASTGDVVLSKSLAFPKPRMVVTWSPDAADQVRLRVEREVGQIDFNDFVASAALNVNGVVAGNPNLVPQQDWVYEATYERHFGRNGVVSLTYQHLTLEDVIDRAPVFSPSGVFDQPANIGGGRQDNLIATFTLPLSRLGIRGGELRGLSTWRVSEVTDPTTGEKRRISGQHPVDAELHFAQDLPRWKVNWGVDVFPRYVEPLFRFNEIDVSHAGTIYNVYLDYRPRPDLVLRVAVTSMKDFDLTRQVFAGPRGAAPLRETDAQRRRFGPILFTRIRKTFG